MFHDPTRASTLPDGWSHVVIDGDVGGSRQSAKAATYLSDVHTGRLLVNSYRVLTWAEGMCRFGAVGRGVPISHNLFKIDRGPVRRVRLITQDGLVIFDVSRPGR